MTPKEFKAWFDGFTEGVSGLPNEDQWARIKARIAQIDGETITEKIFIERYRSYPYWGYGYYPFYTCSNTAGIAQNNLSSFNSTTAMYLQGKNDAVAMGVIS